MWEDQSDRCRAPRKLLHNRCARILAQGRAGRGYWVHWKAPQHQANLSYRRQWVRKPGHFQHKDSPQCSAKRYSVAHTWNWAYAWPPSSARKCVQLASSVHRSRSANSFASMGVQVLPRRSYDDRCLFLVGVLWSAWPIAIPISMHQIQSRNRAKWCEATAPQSLKPRRAARLISKSRWRRRGTIDRSACRSYP